MFGLILGQLVIAVLGALTITSEYSTGMIRTSLTVMPRRGTVYAAKAVVFTLVALVAGLVTSFGSYFIGQAIFATHHLNSHIGQPGVLRAVIGGGLFLAVCGLFSYGIGALLRSTAGAITASVALLFVVFVLSGFLPSNWAEHIDKWIPLNAGGAIWENLSGVKMFSPWVGFGVFCAYAAIAVLGLYVGALVPRPARTVATGLCLLLAGVFLWGLAGKVIPALFPDGARVARLRNPVGYWNSFALLAAIFLFSPSTGHA